MGEEVGRRGHKKKKGTNAKSVFTTRVEEKKEIVTWHSLFLQLMLWGFSTWGLIGGGKRVACDNVPIRIPEWGWQYMIGWLNDINRLVSKDKREPRVIPAENTHTLALYEKVSAQVEYLWHICGDTHHCWRHLFPFRAARNCLFWWNRWAYYQMITNRILLAREKIILAAEVRVRLRAEWAIFQRVTLKMLLSVRSGSLQLWWLSSR